MSEAEVGQDRAIIGVDEDIIGLDVAVNNAFGVNIFDCQNLCEDVSSVQSE